MQIMQCFFTQINVKGLDNSVTLNLTIAESSRRLNQSLRVKVEKEMTENVVSPNFEVRHTFYNKPLQ